LEVFITEAVNCIVNPVWTETGFGEIVTATSPDWVTVKDKLDPAPTTVIVPVLCAVVVLAATE